MAARRKAKIDPRYIKRSRRDASVLAAKMRKQLEAEQLRRQRKSK